MRGIDDDHFGSGGNSATMKKKESGNRSMVVLSKSVCMRTYRSSSKSIVQSLLVGLDISGTGGWRGTYTGTPPLKVTEGRY